MDCLVIGAGPAGSITAREVAKNGWKVLLIEKRAEIGVPVRCGEGVSKSLLDLIGLDKDPSFISAEMDGAKIHSPGGSVLVLGPEISGPAMGFVIQREKFDQELAKHAVRSGAELWIRAEAHSYKKINEGAEVGVKHLTDEETIKAKVVVATDGFESLIARWAGIDTKLDLKDISTCLQYEMVDVDTDDRYTEFFLGKCFVPGGYVWCFPKGPGVANIGLGVNGTLAQNGGDPRRYLDSFISSNPRFSKGRITEINGGGVSVSLPLKETVGDHIVIVGDAARMIDPITGGGIYNGCYAAIQAGRTICEALEKGDTSREALEPYERRWRDGLETEMVRNYLAKEKLLEVSDETLDKVISAISEYDLQDISTEELLKAIADKHPEVIEDLGSLL